MLTVLERELLAYAARRDPQGEILEAQVARMVVKSREYTGVGFYTAVEIVGDVPLFDAARYRKGDIPEGFATHPELDGGAGFNVWLENGRIVCLEGYTYGGAWPADESSFTVPG